MTVVTGSDQRPHHMHADKFSVYDPYLLWRPNPALADFINRKGFRGKDFPETKPAGTRRIVALGDSNTIGGIPGDNWPQYLDRYLQSNFQNEHYAVINAGVWGYTSWQGLRRFRQVLAYGPDLVLVSFGANDAHKVTIPDKYYGGGETKAAEFVLKTRTYQLVLATAGWLRGRSQTGQPLTARVSLSDYRKNLEELIKLARQHGIGVVLLTRPFMGVSPDPLWWKVDAPKYNALTIQVGRENGVPVLDIYALLRDREDLFHDESHLTSQGHAEMARAVCNFLMEQGLISAKADGRSP